MASVPAAPRAGAASSANTTECRCVGSPPNDNIASLLSLLRGLCYKYGSFQYYDIVLRAPLQGGSTSTTIRLTRSMLPDNAPKNPFAEVLPDRWTMRVESLPSRQVRRDGGGGGAEGQVSVREVVESACYGNLTKQFWQAMGAKLDYEAVRKGNEYCCLHEGREIKVQLLTVQALQEAGRPESAASGRVVRYIVDVTLCVAEEERAEGQRVMEAFAARLAQHVVLGRADVGFT